MKACGLIVEYNPFHNGHIYHIQKAQELSRADCMIAVMSGPFLQRGEPAIIDKFHRAKAALATGVDIVVELPFAYAVQSSELFAKGSVQTLHEIGVSSICFGSESGTISNFLRTATTIKENETIYKETLHEHLKRGSSFPEASKMGYQKIGLTNNFMDMSQPNNILGFSYVKTIVDNKLPIIPLTTKRTKSGYHEQIITSSIASATSIRNELLLKNTIDQEIIHTLPIETVKQLQLYKNKATTWHSWENYFHLLHYRVMTMTLEELRAIQGVDEGLENRIKKTANEAASFKDWMEAIKTKRYTWTRLQRMFVHILTNTKKTDIEICRNDFSVPYIRLLGLSEKGQSFLNYRKKEISVPIVTKFSRDVSPMLAMDEVASNAYYSILPLINQKKLRRQELQPPMLV